MNRTWNIVIATAMWCAIAAYLVAAGSYSNRKRAGVTVTATHAVVADSASLGLVSTARLSKWLSAGGFDPIGKPIDEVDTHAIEEYLMARGEVGGAKAWVNLDGLLTVKVTQRRPIMRVLSSNGYRFWVTDDNYILPDRGEFTAYVPVVTGNTPFPFGAATSGSYDSLLDGVYNDFLARFTELENERRSLASQRDDVRGEIRTVRATRPKRLWSDERKKKFREDRDVQIAALQQRVAGFDRSLRELETRRNAMLEKEKKSHQSHMFLTKLVNFVKSVSDDGFWASQIVQVNVLGGGGGSVWKEPQIELIPRAGDHIILLGELDGNEAERLEKLRIFYHNALSREGWETQRYINIKYDRQVICTR